MVYVSKGVCGGETFRSVLDITETSVDGVSMALFESGSTALLICIVDKQTRTRAIELEGDEQRRKAFQVDTSRTRSALAVPD